ncbi:MAG: extensin family protein [Hyphomicrobiaceae bacterium]
MSKLGVRISRWSLLLSLAVKAGLAAWVLFAFLGEPTGGVALPAPGAETLRAPSSVEPAKETRRQRRERLRRERLEREEEAARAAEKAEIAEKEAAEKEAAAREAAAKEAAAKEAAAREAAALEAAKRRSDQSIAGEPIGKNAFDISQPPKGKARTEPGKGTASNTLPVPSEPEPVPDKWSDQEVIAALEECLALLAPLAAHIDVSKPIRDGQCGSAAVVQLKRVGATAPVEISPPATLNCRMVVKLHQWVETSLQPAARETFNAPVRRLVNASGYTCRNRYGSNAVTAKISEHAFANALDVSAIVLADGRSVDVLSNWGHTERDLRAIAEAKAEAERQAKAAAAAQKAAAKASKDAKPEPADAKKAKAGGKEHAANKEEPPAKGGKGSAAKDDDGDVVEGQPTSRDVKKKETQRGRPLASAERQGLGRPDILPVPGGDTTVTKEGAFLRRLHRGACGIFSTVLGPEANEAHRNHFHFDLAPRRRNAFCE